MLIPLLQVNTANNLVNKHSIDNCMGNGNGGQKMKSEIITLSFPHKVIVNKENHILARRGLPQCAID